MYAPMGIGILYGREELLNQMPPYQGGGEMIKDVTFAKTTYNELPYKFEAGTPSVGDALGLGAAIDYMQQIGINAIAQHEQMLLDYATQKLLDKLGIAVRTGHHCTQPIMDHYGIPGTVRASFAIYNTQQDVDDLISALIRIATMLD